MEDSHAQLVAIGAASPADVEAISYLKTSLAGGRHWYIALLGAMGLWASASEQRDGRTSNYLIDNEAFDWLLLAERLCETVEGLLPEDEKNTLLFYGIPPLRLESRQVKKLIGSQKYSQYLNYFYGITVEEGLQLAVQEEIDKERRLHGFRTRQDSTGEAFRRIYNATRDSLLQAFRREKGHAHLESIGISELKEFTYWLFKHRLKHCEKARIASDTAKSLRFLKKQWGQRGVFKVLAIDMFPDNPDKQE
jgi:hypothetical protein